METVSVRCYIFSSSVHSPRLMWREEPYGSVQLNFAASRARRGEPKLAQEMDASYAYLKDFDWSVRLALSSDKLSGLRKPLLLLKLETVAADGTRAEKILELNEEELDTLLQGLKKVQGLVER